MAVARAECRLPLVTRLDADTVVGILKVNLGKILGTSEPIHEVSD